MKFIKNWFNRAVHNAMSSPEPANHIGNAICVKENDSFRDSNCLNIEVRGAIGGRIVSFRSYDRRTDRSDIRNYLIHDDSDFERELGKIITIESMRS